MKIALCLSGQPRCFDQGFVFHYHNIIKHNDVDVFCHVWKFDDVDSLIELYKPKKIIVEEMITPDLSKYTRVPAPTPNWKVKNPALSTYAQLYAIDKVFSLKRQYEIENNFQYDWAIRSRYDFAVNFKIPFVELNKNYLYIPNCRMTVERDFGNDQFAFSSSENMDKYSDTFNQLDYFYDNGTIMIGEEMMSANWKQKKLVGENLMYFEPNHIFPPGAYNGTPHSLIRDDFDLWQKS